MLANNLSEYITRYKQLQQEQPFSKKIKVAVLASSTIKGIKEILTVKCHEIGISADVYLAEYNQYNQEILQEKSQLYQFSADLVVLFIDIKSLLGDIYYDYDTLSTSDRQLLFSSKLDYIYSLIAKVKSNLNSKIIVHNFELPIYAPRGIIDNKQDFGIIEFVEQLNGALRNHFKKDTQVFIFDYNSFLSAFGKSNVLNYKMYYLADIKIDLPFLPALAQAYMAYIKPLMTLTKKCLVLDLDNTIWGGIIAEDGMEGIKLGPNSQGRSFVEFQKYILSLFNRGIILAVNSKNNLVDALEVFNKHPYMILKEHHFASMKINWDDKISNMNIIAKELNIGLDSLIFLDDDQSNCAMIRAALPQVKVIEMPRDPALYVQTLMEIDDFNTFQITDEDLRRGQMYAQQRKREEFSQSISDMTEFLKGLNIRTTIELANNFSIPRISQLTQKTNQFNLTTKRYQEEDIKYFASSKEHMVFSVSVEDRFGNNGLTGVVIIKKESQKWFIDTFLLSCREIGKRIEEVMMAYIIETAKNEGVNEIVGQFIPTKKNEPAKDFYQKNGFELMHQTDSVLFWKRDSQKDYPYPSCIEVIKI